MNYSIQTNPTGTRHVEVTDEHLATIKAFGLFDGLVDSNGIVDESVLEKLKLNIRSLITVQVDDVDNLLALAIDVIYHKNMKAFGLQELMKLYQSWSAEDKEPATEGTEGK